MIDLRETKQRLTKRYETDLELLEEIQAELVSLAEHLDSVGADEEYCVRCAKLLNMAAYVSGPGADLWEALRKIYNSRTCVLDLTSPILSMDGKKLT